MNLKSLYSDYTNPAAFGGVNKFYKYAKTVYPNLSRADVKKFLESVDSYTIHRPKRKVKKFRRIMVKRIGYQYSMDLVVLEAYSRENSGYRYILNIIGEE